VAHEIGLKNVTTQHIRAEEIKNRKFDFVVSRAVAPLKELWKWSKPLLKAQGTRHKAQERDKTQGSRGKEQMNKEQGTRNGELDGDSFKPGLICLKGGDLAQEIHDSHTRPRVYDISEIFEENSFKEKYILYIKK
jgi:16S rRNA (guanine527-N7)-methyltransferase